MEEFSIDGIKIPEWWPVCQQADCPQAAACLRRQAFMRMPRAVDAWSCVMPWAESNGDCRYFFSTEKQRMARGFTKMFANMHNREDLHNLRLELTTFLGSKGSYDRYKKGEKLLTPDEQQWILQRFRQYGYEEGLEFDEYVYCYNFKRLF